MHKILLFNHLRWKDVPRTSRCFCYRNASNVLHTSSGDCCRKKNDVRSLLMKFFTKAQFLFALHCVKLSVLTSDCKMESDSEASDIISINTRRRQDNVESDSNLEEIDFPLLNRRGIISDDEEEAQNENRERNVSSQEQIWKYTENTTQVWRYLRISKINILVGQNVTALQMTSGILAEDFWKIIVTETNRYANQTLQNENCKLQKFEDI